MGVLYSAVDFEGREVDIEEEDADGVVLVGGWGSGGDVCSFTAGLLLLTGLPLLHAGGGCKPTVAS